jgi:Domain of unknown function (DUF4124)
MCRVTVLALLLCCALPLQAEEIYTWTDAAGVVHFSATPPPGQQVSKETLRYQRGDPAVAEVAQKRWEGEEKATQEQSDARERDAGSAAARGAERARSCATAREIVQSLESAPATRYRREDGSFQSYTPDEVAQRLDQARARELEYCD